MGRLAHVFIDESGQHHRGDCYAVGATWCLSEREDASTVLKPTKLALLELLEDELPSDSSPGEIKSSSLRASEVELLAENIQGHVFQDSTLVGDRLPWRSDCPIQVSIHDLNPDVGVDALGRLIGDLQAPQAIQLLSLLSILSPLTGDGQFQSNLVDEIHVHLDATIWQNSAQKAQLGFERVAELPVPISFQTRDSRATPGIQLSDVVANAWQRHLRRGECNGAARTVEQLRISNPR